MLHPEKVAPVVSLGAVRCQVSGFGCQGTKVLNPDTSYETF